MALIKTRVWAALFWGLPGFFLLPLFPTDASQRQEVYVTATVEPFRGYTFTHSVEFTVTKPGPMDVGTVVVDGTYNGEYPWIMRIYTDNMRFSGVAGIGQRSSAAGLVSKDGRFTLPIQVHTPNFGLDVWRTIPDLNQSSYKTYQPNAKLGVAEYTDCILMGIDPRNADWVAGPDGVLFTPDDNLIGDITNKTPFELELRTDVSPTAVQGDYEGNLYIEVVPCP